MGIKERVNEQQNVCTAKKNTYCLQDRMVMACKRKMHIRRGGVKMTEIKSIKMDYFGQAIGTGTMPSLSWVIQSDMVCVIQTAYQIQLSKNADFKEILYDSTKVISSESSGIKTCDASDLDSCSRYWIRVKVWVSEGFHEKIQGKSQEKPLEVYEEESNFSTPVSFVTGLLKNEWHGDFVSAETKADKSNSKGTYLRKSFEVRKSINCSKESNWGKCIRSSD